MNNLDQSLIDGLYKEMVKELNRLFTSSNYHVRRTAADNAREAQRCLNQNLRRCNQGYQVQIPEEYFNKDYTATVVYIIIKNI
jgi:hypothetical protein